MSVYCWLSDCMRVHAIPDGAVAVALARSAAMACIFGGSLVAMTADAQSALPDDGFISLIETPLMQQPVEQGSASLLPMQTPPPVALEADWGGALLKSSAQTRTLCESSVAQLSNGQVQQAFDALVPYWPMSHEEVARLVSQTQAQLAQLTASYGSIVGYEWVRSRDAGSSLVQHWFLVKMPYHALRIGCTFYKPMQTWQVHTVMWDDQIDALFGP